MIKILKIFDKNTKNASLEVRITQLYVPNWKGWGKGSNPTSQRKICLTFSVSNSFRILIEALRIF